MPILATYSLLSKLNTTEDHELILDGNSEHVAHALRQIGVSENKKKTIFDCSRLNKMP